MDECSLNYGGCDDVCNNTPGSFSCSCSTGYMLLMDGRTCADVNECKGDLWETHIQTSYDLLDLEYYLKFI